MNTNYKIMIVGGGPAGLSTWLHLNKYSDKLAKKALIIEKSCFPREKICGGGLGAWSTYVLDHLDIKLTIPYLPISDIEFVYHDKKYNLHQKNQLLMTKRSEFDYLLVKNGIQRGLQIHEDECIIDFRNKGKDIVVKTNLDTYLVNILVGADGSLSKVRRLMKVKNKNHLSPTLEVFSPPNPDNDAEYDEKKVTIDLSYIDDGLQGYFWHIPTIHNNKPMIGHGIADFRLIEDKKRASIKNIFQTELKLRKIDIPQNQWLSHPIRWYGKEDKISCPHVILAGDAVGIEPAFGGGIHFALSYGQVAATSILKAYELDDFSFTDYKERIDNHLIGKFIRKCEYLGEKMFSLEGDPIEISKQLFTIKKDDW